MLKSCFSCDRLRLAVVELALRVDVQPTCRVGVLVALDLAGLALPLVVWRFIWKGCLDWSIVRATSPAMERAKNWLKEHGQLLEQEL